mgnify:CR=1 FL=1
MLFTIFDNRAADAHTTRVFHTKHMSLVLPIIIHFIRRSSTMLSTRPTSILNLEVGLRILVVIVCYYTR